MKFYILYAYIFLIFSSTQAQSDVVEEFDLNSQIYFQRLNVGELKFGFNLGLKEGTFTFHNEVMSDDCVYMTLQSGEFVRLEQRFEQQLLGAKDTYFQTGYRTGWLLGFHRAYQTSFASCENTIQEETKLYFKERVELCRSQFSNVRNMMQYISDFDVLRATEVSAFERQELMTLVYLGDGQNAWEQFRTYNRNNIFAIPCYMELISLLTENLAQ